MPLKVGHCDARIACFMEALLDESGKFVRFRTLVELHAFLKARGFILAWVRDWPEKRIPPGKLFYYFGLAFPSAGGGIIVRVKTHGERPGKERAFKPHLSVTWQDGIAKYGEEATEFQRNEKGKFNASGQLEKKSPTGSESERDAWGDRTHPLFHGFEDSNATNPRGLPGAEEIPEDGGNAG
jgi:hypothetical protein